MTKSPCEALGARDANTLFNIKQREFFWHTKLWRYVYRRHINTKWEVLSFFSFIFKVVSTSFHLKNKCCFKPLKYFFHINISVKSRVDQLFVWMFRTQYYCRFRWNRTSGKPTCRWNDPWSRSESTVFKRVVHIDGTDVPVCSSSGWRPRDAAGRPFRNSLSL